MQVEGCIFFQLYKAGKAGGKFWARTVAHLKITAVQAMVLNALGDEDKVPSNNLGKRVSLTSATLTGIIDRLEKQRFLERRANEKDRRAILICLTEKGKDIVHKIKELDVQANKQFFEGLSNEEELILRGLLTRISKKE